MAEPAPALLAGRDLISGYGKKQVLNGVSVDVHPGEIVAIIGHNGAGKSTLLKTIFGLLPLSSGQVLLDGKPHVKLAPRALLMAGVAYCPQGNRVFGDLTVHENLQLGDVIVRDRDRLRQGIERSLELFPALKDKLRQRAGTLSGGEKQMLALGAALVTFPRLLLLDEPSLGLAPPLIPETLTRIQSISKDSGVAALIVEQKVREVLKIASRVYVLRNGRVSYEGPAADLHDDQKLREVYL